MKKLAYLALIPLIFCATQAAARDDVGNYSITSAMNTEAAKSALGDTIRFYFGDQSYGAIAADFGEFGTNKKTNAFNKSDQEACEWVFLSAMIALRDRAVREGGNAVVDIKSNYKSNLTSSTETFQCGAGNVLAGVALTGRVVTLQ